MTSRGNRATSGSRLARAGIRWLGGACLALLLTACGDDAPEEGGPAGPRPDRPPPGAPEGWSPPASGDASPVLTAKDAMRAVENMLQDPKTLRSEAWGSAVRRLTQILWPIATGESPLEAARTHEQLAQIVSSMAIELDKDPLLAESLEDHRKIEYEIHGEYRRLLEKKPDEFRTFFGTKGVALLRAHAEAMQQRFFGPK